MYKLKIFLHYVELYSFAPTLKYNERRLQNKYFFCQVLVLMLCLSKKVFSCNFSNHIQIFWLWKGFI